MRKILATVTLTVAATFGVTTPVFASEIPAFPSIGSVADDAGILTASDEETINAQITAIEAATGHDIAVLTVTDMNGSSIEDFSITTAREWGLGSVEAEDGVLLVIAMEERELRLEVGTGLESVVTNSDASNIIDDIIAPHLTTKDYVGGITAGLTELDTVFTSTPVIDSGINKSDDDSTSVWFILVGMLIGLIIIGVIIRLLVMSSQRKAAEKARKLRKEKQEYEAIQRKAEEERRIADSSYKKQKQIRIEKEAADEAAYNKAQHQKQIRLQKESAERKRIQEAFYLTPEGQIAKAKKDRQNEENAKKRKDEAERRRKAEVEKARVAAEEKAETANFFKSLDSATVKRIKNAGSKISRQRILQEEIRKARDKGVVSSNVNTDNMLSAVMLYSAFAATTSSSSYGTRSSGGSSSSRSSYNSDSGSSFSSGFSSGDSGGGFSGGGDSGSF